MELPPQPSWMRPIPFPGPFYFPQAQRETAGPVAKVGGTHACFHLSVWLCMPLCRPRAGAYASQLDFSVMVLFVSCDKIP